MEKQLVYWLNFNCDHYPTLKLKKLFFSITVCVLFIGAAVFTDWIKPGIFDYDATQLQSRAIAKEEHNGNLQSIFNQYVDIFSSLIQQNLTYNNNYNDIIIHNKYTFKPISKQFIINTLSNKTIRFLGDSLIFFPFTYIIHTIKLCLQDEINKFLQLSNTTNSPYYFCPSFCNHLNPQNTQNNSLILSPQCVLMLQNRDNLQLLTNNFSIKWKPTLSNTVNAMYYIPTYNITLLIDYMWGNHLNADNMSVKSVWINKLRQRDKYDIIITNMISMHSYIRRYKSSNINFAFDFLFNLEEYMTETMENKANDSCLIFGPLNPVYNNEMNVNISGMLWSERDVASPYLDDIINPEMDMYTYSVDRSCVNFCKRFNKPVNETDYLCRFYFLDCSMHNLLNQRMKRFVGKNNYNEKKVYYHNQYQLYWSFTDLRKYVDNKGVHYLGLQPISWTNLLNIIDKGC
eukprot:316126_1